MPYHTNQTSGGNRTSTRQMNNQTRGFGDDIGFDDIDPDRRNGFGDDIGFDDFEPDAQMRYIRQINNQTRGFGDDLGIDGYDPEGFGDDLGYDGYDPEGGGINRNLQGGSNGNPIGFGDDIGFDDFDPENRGDITPYKIFGTNQSYKGLVIFINNEPYTTRSGGIEGNRQLLERGSVETPRTQVNTNSAKDVITPFIVGDRSNFGRGTYYYKNGIKVPINTKLHHHTIIPDGRTSNFMTQHVMDGTDVDVFTTRPSTRTQTRTQIRTQTSSGGTSRGGRSGY